MQDKMTNILGECKCGERVTKFINDPLSARTDGINYKLTNDENSTWTMFRCKKCSAVIHESFRELK